MAHSLPPSPQVEPPSPEGASTTTTTTTTTSPLPRLKLHQSTGSSNTNPRTAIMNSSSNKGWSPLQITKRDTSDPTSPLRPNHTGSSVSSEIDYHDQSHPPPTGIPAPKGTTRRTSSSFRHMATNSLVAKSPFKDLKTREGALSNGLAVSSGSNVIHERRSTTRALGQAPEAAYGSASTPRNAIGLGIATPSRSAGSAVTGQRRVSNERTVVIPASVDRYDYTDRERSSQRRKERKERKERRSSKENSEPRRTMPRKSLAYRATVEGERVTKSPFRYDRNEDADDENASMSTEILASPSPRRTSGSNRRRASPSTNLSSSRTSMSNSPSVSPQPSRIVSVTVQASPLSKELVPVPPSPTPTKSAMASSRRLGGPRAKGAESPTRKTVTFQVIPDIKEFDVPSREVSMASISREEVEDEDWVDEAELDWVGKVVMDEPDVPLTGLHDISQDSEDLPQGDNSTTADFMDSLIEEGLFSESQEENAFDDDSQFEIPMESFTEYMEGKDGDNTPMASTPLFEYHDLPMPSSPQHVHTTVPHLPPAHQPDLPHSDDHSMLRTANAAQPTLPGPHASSPGPHAHQEGQLYDPFLTIQTATDVLVEHKARAEGDVPLGRTSHADRVQAARMLATQKLGLGYPANLPRAAPPTHEPAGSDTDSPIARPAPVDNDVFGAVVASPAARKTSDRKVSDVPVYEGPSNRMSIFRANKSTSTTPTSATPTSSTPTRRPLPPPAQVDIPSPVQLVSPRPSEETLIDDSDLSDAEVYTARRTELFPMVLPTIGTSPLMTPVASDAELTESESEAGCDKDLPPTPKSSGRVSDIAPRLSLSAELEEREMEEEGESDVEMVEQPVTPRRQRTHSPEIDDVSQQLAAATIEDSDKEGSDKDNHDEATDDEPLTPPPGVKQEVRKESPRIPSFEFDGGLGLGGSEDGHDAPPSPSPLSPMTPKPNMIITAPSPSTPGTSRSGTPSTPLGGRSNNTSYYSPMGTPSRSTTPVRVDTPTRGTPVRTSSPLASAPVQSVECHVEDMDEDTSIIASEFGVDNSGTLNDASTQTRIRQRISREMIRETVNQRVAAGGLPRPMSMIDAPRPSMIDAPRRRNVSPLRIAPRTPRGNKTTAEPRSPTSPTASAALQQLRDSNDSPQSALDRIMNQLGQENRGSRASTLEPLSPTKVITPVSILRKAHESEEPDIPPSLSGSIINPPEATTMVAARKSRRRSASVSDVTPRRAPRLTLGLGKEEDNLLASVRDEIENIGSQRGYKVRERSEVRVTYTGGLTESTAGNLEVGKAWRPVRRPSDMNEHTKEIRAARAREASEGKSSGTIFVKVLGVEALNLPLPMQETYFCITLDNGIDYIRTPYGILKEGAHVNQEFSLVEHKNFEFSLSLDVRRDPHIVKLVEERANNAAKAAAAAASAASAAALAASTATMASTRLEPPRAIAPPRPTSPSVSSMTSRSGFGAGFRSLFSSPRKNKHQRTQSTPASALSQSTSILPSLPSRRQPPPPPPVIVPPPRDTIAKYLVETGGNTVAKTHIAFKPIAKQCEAKVLEIRYPMFAMFKAEGTTTRQQVAKVTIQVLRLPPLPGLSPEDLPGSIEDTLRGLRHHAWHLHQYNEGVLTQLGGDCRVPRRRLFRLVGGNLLAVNEVTKKEVASIDLKLATSIVDCNVSNPGNDDDYDPYSARPRSFRIRFADGEGINFSADRDEDKAVWMDTFQGLIGRIPSNPLWAELLAEHDSSKEADEEEDAKEEKRRASKTPRKSGRISSNQTRLQPKVRPSTAAT